jgi:3,4-dihydroxy 2-butanone 4-phosphate synthase/GTP cyclohydrolase II
MQFGTVEQAIADIRAGKLIIVADDEDRENEGDLICAAQLVTPELINFMIKKAGGWICLALTGERADQLQLPQQSKDNTEEQRTAFTVTIDAASRFGVTTGISAQDRAKTIRVAVDPATVPADLRRPGHISPLRARDGGVLQRVGHTEAAVDLARLAGVYPAGVVCEILRRNNGSSSAPREVRCRAQPDVHNRSSACSVPTPVRATGSPRGRSAATYRVRRLARCWIPERCRCS